MLRHSVHGSWKGFVKEYGEDLQAHGDVTWRYNCISYCNLVQINSLQYAKHLCTEWRNLMMTVGDAAVRVEQRSVDTLRSSRQLPGVVHTQA